MYLPSAWELGEGKWNTIHIHVNVHIHVSSVLALSAAQERLMRIDLMIVLLDDTVDGNSCSKMASASSPRVAKSDHKPASFLSPRASSVAGNSPLNQWRTIPPFVLHTDGKHEPLYRDHVKPDGIEEQLLYTSRKRPVGFIISPFFRFVCQTIITLIYRHIL